MQYLAELQRLTTNFGQSVLNTEAVLMTGIHIINIQKPTAGKNASKAAHSCISWLKKINIYTVMTCEQPGAYNTNKAGKDFLSV